MKRRNAVKGIILFSLGTGIIYSCTDKYEAIRALGLNHFEPLDTELRLIETLSQAIVPFNLIPELSNHTALPLMFTMIDDVYDQADRDAFQKGYQHFDKIIESSEKKKFSKMNELEREALLSRFNDHEIGMDEVAQSFYDIVKKESIRYFKSSEYYQRKVNYYEMAPGRFNGDVLLSDLKNVNQI